MAKRTCDVCGEKKSLRGGKTCEKGHFVCKSCYRSLQGAIKDVLFGPVKKCPIDGKPLK